MKIKLLIVCALLTASILNAQTDFRPGYVIGFSGDTLYGEIDYRGDLLMGSLCKYKSPDGTITEYTPYDIAALEIEYNDRMKIDLLTYSLKFGLYYDF